MSAMATAMGELRADVARLREERAAARALARDASRRVAWWFAAGGLTLAAVNVAVVIWVGSS